MATGTTNAMTIVGGAPATGHRVRFVFPDGTILGDQIVTNGGNAIIPDSGTYPTISNCTFYGWNQATTNITHPREIGAIYRTTNTNKSYFIVDINNTSGLSGMQMNFSNVNNPSLAVWNIDWGDGEITTSTANGSDITISKPNPYLINGLYTIILDSTNVTNFSMSNTSAPLNTTFNPHIKQINFGEKLNTSSLSNTLPALEILTIGSTGAFNPGSGGYSSLKALILNSNCSSITFGSAYNLKAISFPDGRTFTLASFINGYQLERFIFPDAQTNSTLTNFSLSGSVNISELWLPLTVTTIPRYLLTSQLIRTFDLSQFTGINTNGNNFVGCGLKNVDVSQISYVTSSMFYYSYNLESVILPTTVLTTSLGANAFSGCYRLKNVNIPTNTKAIGSSMFTNCFSLEELDFPSTLTSIGNSALQSLFSLKKLIVRSTTPPTLGTNVFTNLPLFTKIYVPDASVAAYQAAWSTYSTQIYPLSSL